MNSLTLEPSDFPWSTSPALRDRRPALAEPAHPAPAQPAPTDLAPADLAPTGPAPTDPRNAHDWQRFTPEVADLKPMSILTTRGHLAGKIGSVLRTLLFVLAGAAPILAIPSQILGIAPLSVSAIIAVVPLGLAALLGMLTEVNEGRWARTGMLTGLAAVAAYDALRLPLVAADIWPDFIPDLGGWIKGFGHDDVVIGYLWRYLGDGGGMGMVFFMMVGLVYTMRPNWIAGRTMTIGIGYGVFIWTGLIGTLLLPGGQETLFAINPVNFVLSLVGHLIYGTVLGLGLRIAVRRNTPKEPAAAA